MTSRGDAYDPHMHRATLLLTLLVACKHDDDLCAKAVHHVFEMTVMSDVAPPSSAEQDAIDLVVKATTGKCREEGLSQAQFDCIVAVKPPAWDDQLRTCAAFAAKPPSWVILRPPRDERIALANLARTPDGPRESPLRFTQLVGAGGTTCGLIQSGEVRCWGQPMRPWFAEDHLYTQIGHDGSMGCALDSDGRLHCTMSDATIPDRAPPDALASFAIDAYRGCGIRKSDQSLVCWNDLDDPPWELPAGSFTQVALTHEGGCALRADHTLACFGEEAPPAGRFVAVAGDVGGICGLTTDGAVRCRPESKHGRALPAVVAFSCSWKSTCCGITKDHQLACTNAMLGPPPTGSFERVAVLGQRACAVRTDGGTICWGENDDGGCNVPAH